MADQELRALVAQGVQALRAGGEVAKKATAEIQNDASSPELKATLQEGNRTSEQWAQRIERALQESGGAEDQGNPVLEAVYEVSRRIRAQAQDPMSRDLGIIASGQIALHYWVAAFGTLRTYAAQVGLSQTEQEMQASLDEAKQADQRYSQLAEQMLGGGRDDSDDRGQEDARRSLTGALPSE